MSFGYSAQVNYAVFSFEPKEPAYSTLINTDSPPQNLEIVYDGSDYKTIGTMLDFSALTGDLPPSTQTTLMQGYLEFFGVNLSGPFPLFHAGMTSVCLDQAVTFTDDSFDNIISRSWEFPGGTPAASIEANPVIRYHSTGKFDVKLTVSDGIHTKTILKEKYIFVDQCSGINEGSAASSLIKIFPNPATNNVTLEFNRNVSGSCNIILLDLTGNKLLETRQVIPQGNRISLNLGGFGKGLYFLKVQAGEMIATLKVIKL
jgi:PKD repeat protein